jgi:hypothetical protein
VRFVLWKKTINVNKTHQLMPGIGTAILQVMEPDRGRWQGAMTLSITAFGITIKM